MAENILNLNVGILGHVDSGKTTLSKALSSIASTAAFDRNRQSQERGITIDLGFSAFRVDMPPHLKDLTNRDTLQFTLVDCPGHATLIRTVIGGSQILDMFILVVDIMKGVQTQTAECLVIGEITCKHMVVVLNKVDLLPPEIREAGIERVTRKMKHTLANTVFKDAPIVGVSAQVGGDPYTTSTIGIPDLIEALKQHAYLPVRSSSGPFLFSLDHCFCMRGQGTVMTGTVLQGCVHVNDVIEIPSLQISKRVRSMQMFRQPIERASQGDRLGICVTQFDPRFLERGILCTPGYISYAHAAIISAQKVKYFKSSVKSKMKFHVSFGYEIVMAKITIFGIMKGDEQQDEALPENNLFSYEKVYKYQEELLPELENAKPTENEIPLKQYMLLEFDKPVLAYTNTVVMGSKLDIDPNSNTCRIAFSGKLLETMKEKNYTTTVLPNLKIYKNKCKSGVVDRVKNSKEIIAKDIFKKETNIQLFTGLKVNLSTGEEGVIDGAFGQSGKINITIPDGLKDTTISQINSTTKKKGKSVVPKDEGPVTIMVAFRRYMYDPEKKITQN